MKKMKGILPVLLAIATMLLSACSSEPLKPQYYYADPSLCDTEEEDFEVRYGKPTEKQLAVCTEVFSSITTFYSLEEKQMPEIRVTTLDLLSKENSLSQFAEADAISYKGIIYIAKETFESDDIKAIIAHEMCHALSYNSDDRQGLYYSKQTVKLGNCFDEGVTNWLSSRVFPYTKETEAEIYLLETHWAEMLSIAFGEENLAKAYFDNDVESLENDFNNALDSYYPTTLEYEGIQLSIFDVWATTITNADMYSTLMYYYNGLDKLARDALNSTEETLLFYGREKGVSDEMVSCVKALMDENPFIVEITDFTKLVRKSW